MRGDAQQSDGVMGSARISFALELGQQPQRARMCGFGDKDRRPITPPPCLRLLVTDRLTGQPVDVSEIDTSFFILSVDLWDEAAGTEVNLVMHHSAIPSGGASPESGGDPLEDAAPGSITRNLIGSLATSAYKLYDNQDRLGIWFVLQDLSVRTEGTFRLKFTFVDLAGPSHKLITSGSVPVLCSVFSDPFVVYSAKKFPGMIESTELSRKFAQQGIKIPIRRVA
ncbi:hypothetical protein PYCC9005_004848 [Savitreella phatthalungensis]